jgi:hypothetical protein
MPARIVRSVRCKRCGNPMSFEHFCGGIIGGSYCNYYCAFETHRQYGCGVYRMDEMTLVEIVPPTDLAIFEKKELLENYFVGFLPAPPTAPTLGSKEEYQKYFDDVFNTYDRARKILTVAPTPPWAPSRG